MTQPQGTDLLKIDGPNITTTKPWHVEGTEAVQVATPPAVLKEIKDTLNSTTD